MSTQSNKLPPIQAPVVQPPYHPTNPYESSSTASTISPQSPGSGTASGGLSNAPRSADTRPYPSRGPVPPVSENIPRYGGEYEPMLMSPAYDQFRGGPRMDAIMAGSPHGHQSIPGAHLQQKRAYRQRRKDPSCDACRERKVKCDATDTSSCSECSSRNVKCQFTKETNRRMSSIKQVQDLEKQLFTAKQQVTQYESMLKSEGLLNSEGVAIEDEDSISGAASPSKRRKIRSTHDTTDVVPLVDTRIGSLMKSFFLDGADDYIEHAQVEDIPSYEKGQEYLDSLSRSSLSEPKFLDFPYLKDALSWATNTTHIETHAKDKLALLSACIMCGALRDLDFRSAHQHYRYCMYNLMRFHKATVHSIQASLLAVIYSIECNFRSQAFELLGLTVGKAIDLGIQCRHGTPPPYDEEQRRELWTALVCWERMISLEYGRPTMIQDNDLGATIVSEGWSTPEAGDTCIGMRRVAKIVLQIQAAFKMPSLSPEMFAKFDDGLLRQLPPPEAYARRGFPWNDLHVLSARFVIYRHNFSPFVNEDIRNVATQACVRIAADTVKLLEQTDKNIQGPDSNGLLEAATQGPATRVIMLLWRSAAMCLYAGELPTAKACTNYLSVIAELRQVGRFCGYHLEYFLDIWRQRVPKGLEAVRNDAELITYASADMQFSHDQAWIGNIGDDSPGEISQVNPPVNGVRSDDNAIGIYKGWHGLQESFALAESEVQRVLQAEQAKSSAPPAEAAMEDARLDTANSASSSRMKITDLMS